MKRMTEDLNLNGEFSTIKSESEINDVLDHISLKQRLRILLANKLHSGRDVVETEYNMPTTSPDPIGLAIKAEEAQCHPQETVLALTAACYVGKIKTDGVRERNAALVPKVATKIGSDIVMPCSGNGSTSSYQDEDLSQNCNIQETQATESSCAYQRIFPEADGSTSGLERFDENDQSLPGHSKSSIPTIETKVEHSDNDPMSSCRRCAIGEPVKVKTEVSDEVGTDELDHIPLKERQRMLLSRQSVGTVSHLRGTGSMEGVCVEPSAYLVDDIFQQNAGKVKEESHLVDEHPLARYESLRIPETNSSECFQAPSSDSPNNYAGPSSAIPQSSLRASNFGDNLSPESSTYCRIQENSQILSSLLTSTNLKSPEGQQVLPANLENVLSSALPAVLGNVKVETLENSFESQGRNEPGISSVDKMLAVKSEMGVSWISYEDELDHIPLRERLKLLISRKVPKFDGSRPSECLQKIVPPIRTRKPTVSENAKPEVINRSRKRKKTATDSVETALEEDAPGLLQVLVDKGILVDEIKLYGGMATEDALDSSFEENSFEDLEGVISKLFAQRETLFKFAPLRCGKGTKAANYCLGCLISLVEQSRYLQFRKWPVEWGWCRDLQSFIFVFERHNRIVLERPEYGYATYFFELVDSLPIAWQIKRLVTAMKLTSCSRATIIENRSLLVGEDLTEGEARVLEEYGWIPNSGLGSMLNYCDRVVHDIKNERDGSEWRSKIGKLLMNGLNGGTVVLMNLPKKVMGYKSTTTSSQIKLEL